MRVDIDNFTWQSLLEYIERRITGTRNAVQMIKENMRLDESSSQATKGLEHQLELLQWCIPLVKELQTKESLQNICPIMSLEIIRLRCRRQIDGQTFSSDFVWILPIADGRFNIKQEDTQSFEGNLRQTVEVIERLVKEMCIKK